MKKELLYQSIFTVSTSVLYWADYIMIYIYSAFKEQNRLFPHFSSFTLNPACHGEENKKDTTETETPNKGSLWYAGN